MSSFELKIINSIFCNKRYPLIQYIDNINRKNSKLASKFCIDNNIGNTIIANDILLALDKYPINNGYCIALCHGLKYIDKYDENFITIDVEDNVLPDIFGDINNLTNLNIPNNTCKIIRAFHCPIFGWIDLNNFFFYLLQKLQINGKLQIVGLKPSNKDPLNIIYSYIFPIFKILNNFTFHVTFEFISHGEYNSIDYGKKEPELTIIRIS